MVHDDVSHCWREIACDVSQDAALITAAAHPVSQADLAVSVSPRLAGQLCTSQAGEEAGGHIVRNQQAEHIAYVD